MANSSGKFASPGKGPLVLHNGRFISQWPCRTGVVVADGVAYAGFSLLPWQDSWLCALDAKTGRATGKGRYLRKLSKITLEGGILVLKQHLVVSQGRVSPLVIRRSDGGVVRSLSGGGGSFLTADKDGLIYHGPGNKTGWITASNPETKKAKRTYNGQVGLVVSESVMVLRSDSQVTAVDRKTKRTIWKRPLPGTFDAVIAGSVVYVGRSNRVTALSLRDGRVLWEDVVEGDAISLATAAGRLFVSTNRGRIHCFHAGDRLTPRRPVVARRPSIDRVQRTAGIDDVTHPGLIHRWVFHSEMSEKARRRGLKNADRKVADRKGKLYGTVLGTLQLRGVGGVEALVLDGRTTSVRVVDDHKQAGLPTKQISAEAWVRVDRAQGWGGIIGAVQDNGKYERGWLLGFRDDRFSFAVATKNAPRKLTYLNAKAPFRNAQWHHVVGTYDGALQRIYVDGKLQAESRVQRGPIEYPPQAFLEIGAYHDKDEYFRITGMLHDVRLYKTALTAKDVSKHYEQNRFKFPQPIRLETGPYVEFPRPGTAVVRWRTKHPSRTILNLKASDGTRRVAGEKLKRVHTVTLDGLSRNRVYQYTIETTGQGGTGTTPAFDLETHFNYALPEITGNNLPNPDEKTAAYVNSVLSQTPVRRGVCVVLGCGDGRFLLELAHRTRFRILAVDTDAKRVETVRRFLRQSRAYGVRVTVRRVASYKRVPFCSRFANLAVTLDTARFSDSRSELLRMLRPGGVGVLRSAMLPAKNRKVLEKILKAETRNIATVSYLPGRFILKSKPVVGSGEWSHLYGSPDNAAFGGEALSGAKGIRDLRVQWMGLPGPRAQADRNGRKPSPLASNGRLFVQGLHRIAALDAYNGSILWSLEIPSFERFNMPRDCGNWCADDGSLFAVVRDKCWQINAQTGAVQRFLQVPAGPRSDWNYEWGYVARAGDKLLGSSVKAGSSFTNFWGKAGAGWYDAVKGPVTFKVGSESLFALDAKTGKPAWTYADGVILNPTITAAGKTVYFLETRHPKIRAASTRRLGTPEVWQQLFLTALDLQTGRKAWERKLSDVDGSVMVSLAQSGGKLVLATSGNGRYDVHTFDAADGKPGWKNRFRWPGGKSDHGKAMSRPAIVGGRVFVRPQVMELKTGKLLPIKIPAGGCGTYACTTNALIYRNGNVTMWDALGTATTSWNRLRPGCWLSTIPACGMLLSPEAGGGCSCGNWMEMSLGFAPRSWDASQP